jgi:hypothetical protein
MYHEYPSSTYEIASEYNGRALKAIQDSLTFALNLPFDPEFQEACKNIENMRATAKDMESVQGLVNQIREKFNSLEDLTVIKAAIDCMLKASP